MATIDIKLKTYEQLQFEIMKLNTNIVLKDKEIERLNNIIDELERWMKDSEIEVIGDSETFSLTYNDALNKLKELKEGKE